MTRSDGRPQPIRGRGWAALAAALAFSVAVGAAGPPGPAHPDNPAWNRPQEPFRVIGNIYYVGTTELAAFLIATGAGHVLIDGGMHSSIPLIERSIERLGFTMSDIRYLLTTQAHFDHVGSMAALAAKSGGQVLVMGGDAGLVEHGGHGDYLFGDTMLFEPVKVARVLHDGDEVRLGGTTLVAHATPGHTPGCTTWTTTVHEGGRTYAVVFAGSTTVNPGTRLTGDPSYAGIREDYERAFRVLRGLHPDVFLGAHASFFGLEDKRARQLAGSPTNPFIDPAGFRAMVDRSEQRFHEQEQEGVRPR